MLLVHTWDCRESKLPSSTGRIGAHKDPDPSKGSLPAENAVSLLPYNLLG
jgi:hypothetical protein